MKIRSRTLFAKIKVRLKNIIDKKKTAGLTVVVEDDVYLPTKKIKSYINLVPSDWDVIRFDCNLDNDVPQTFKTFGKLVFKTNINLY